MGYNGRYSFVRSNCNDLHPGIQGNIVLDGKNIGIIGKIHPSIIKKDVFIFEINLNSLIGKTSKLKYKSAFKYPSITKDMAYIVDKNILVGDIISTIKKAGDKTLQDVVVFDVYEGDKINNDKKSVAFSLVFNGIDHTLKDEDVMVIFNNIIKEVKNKYKAVLRDN